MFARIALDVLPVQASSVPCECLFSSCKQTATDRWAHLGADKFEQLQLMKSAWHQDLVNFAAWNTRQVEDIDLDTDSKDLKVYEALLWEDGEIATWNKEELSFIDLNTFDI